MNIEEFITLLKRLYDGETLSASEQEDLDLNAVKLLTFMAKDEIDYDSQNALDTYIEFYEGLNGLSLQQSRNIRKYHEIIEQKRKEREKGNAKVIKPIDNSGIIKTISIIEIVCVLGIFIAALVLAIIFK